MPTMPTDITYGKVTGRFLTAVGDGPDGDALPDVGVPTGLTVRFTPKQTMRKTDSPSAFFVAKPITCTIDVDGNLIDPQSAVGVWLVAGLYTVAYAGASDFMLASHEVEVTTAHTEGAPLDLVRAMPPGPILTPTQYTELNGRITVLESAPASGDYATNTALTTGLAGKADTAHGHVIGDVSGLQAALDAKQGAGSYAPALGGDDNYVTDAEKAALHGHANKAALDSVSGVNTGDQVLPTWTTISGKPAAVAEGATAAAARTAIGAGTSDLAIGTTGSTAAAGNRAATETATGMVELATVAEATTGTDTVRAVTPAGVKAVADTKAALSHTHTAANVTDLTETVQDIVAAMMVAGTNVTVSYDDASGQFTINSTAGGGGGGSTDPEIVRDVIGAAMVAGSGIQITVNDAGDQITVASTAVLPTRTITAGTGLTGGGDLSADRSLAVAYGSTAGTAAQGNDSRLSDARTPTAHTHAQSEITGLDAALTGKAAKRTPADYGTGTPSASTVLYGDGQWKDAPSGGVSSVNDQTGNVSLDAADVGAVASRNVRAYGAVGDGTADDTAAIQAAIDAGGLVSFDPGTYRITEPLVLKSGTILQGCHAPSYSPNVNPTTNGSKIIAADGYTSGSLISVAGNAWGCAIYNMLICGNNQGADVHGVGLPQTIPGELSFRMRDVQIAGMSGAGIEGSLHVGQLYGVHIGRCGSNAIRVTGSNRWVDVKVVGMFAYFNMRSALYFAGGHTGSVEFSMCRFERSGQVFGDPDNTGSGFNSDEAGVRIRRGQFISFLSCTTDANTGPGFHVDGQASAASQLTDISFMQCRASRDGGGDQDGTVDGAGFLVSAFSEDEANRPRRMSFTACTTATGRSNDGGGSGPISPRRGLSNTGAWQTVWHGRIPQVAGGGTAFHLSGDNYGCSIFYATDDGRTFVWQPHVGAAVHVGGGVSSVNGATGAVVLDAADVGAAPAGQVSALDARLATVEASTGATDDLWSKDADGNVALGITPQTITQVSIQATGPLTKHGLTVFTRSGNSGRGFRVVGDEAAGRPELFAVTSSGNAFVKGYLQTSAHTATPSAGASAARIYTLLNSTTSKHELYVRFPTGSPILIATEP